jgi:hypothetical protein
VRGIYLILSILFFSACGELKPIEVETYYDLDSLLDIQYSLLKDSDLRVSKYSSVNSSEDTVVISPDSTQWQNELSVYRKANINKPLLRGKYEVIRKVEKEDSLIRYSALQPEDMYVKELMVNFSRGELVGLEATVADENPVYGAQRHLQMWFKSENDRPMLERYSITGKQKMILKDTVTLAIVSEIIYE